ncbi:MAG: substrate-binding domain-containing protein [Flavisolibacter sp.]
MKGCVLRCSLGFFIVQGLWILLGCAPKNRDKHLDNFNTGTIHISCDESFKPVIDQQVAVFESSYPDAKIIVHYKAEAECLRDFKTDSIRMVLATRSYSPGEKKFMIDSVHVVPDYLVVARDLIAVVLNPKARDSFFSMKEIRNLLTGQSTQNLIPVFDGGRATSTVRFMLDSVLKGSPLGKNVVAAHNTVEVIDYVARTVNAVGFIGYSWIGNQDDTAQIGYANKIKLAYVESTDSANGYVRPSQYLIYTKTYPMVRNLVYIIKENHQGLGHGFGHFLEDTRGQLIFRRAYLMPVIHPNYVRNAHLQ